MKIAHVDSERSWRGGQAQVAALISGLTGAGDECFLFAPAGPLAELMHERGIPARTFDPGSDLDLMAAYHLAGQLRREAPQLVHAHSARAHAVSAMAVKLAGDLPLVVSRRVDFDIHSNPFSALKYRLGVDLYLCISEGVERVLHRGGVDPRKTVIVPSGIDVDRWRELPDPHPLREELGVPAEARIVGSLAALAPHKDQRNLLLAARILQERRPEVRWVVFGEGECRGDLERRREELGLTGTVLLPGFTADVGAALALLEVFVLSSYLEGLGTSVLDAQAAGVPVVATAVGGVPEMIEDGINGWLVPGRDPVALAGAVEEALEKPGEAGRRAAAARESVRRFSIENTIRLTKAAYQRVLESRRGNRS